MAAEAVKRITESNLESERKKSEDLDRNVEYDELLSSAGELGKYQILLFLSTFPFYMFGTFVYYSQLFITEASSNYWCRIPELEHLTEEERRTLAIPLDENSRFGYSQCTAYVANWAEVLATGQTPNSTWETAPCQHGWEFDKSEIPYPTISSELGWVCDNYSYQASSQAIFFVGCGIGCLVFGWVADRFGRLPAIVGSNMIACIGGVASTFTSDFITFTICRFIMGLGYDTCMMMAYLLMLEYVAPKYRSLFGNLAFAIFYAIFTTSMPWIMLLCGHWQVICLVTSIPSAFAILTPLIIPESPRWLLSKGRVEETVKRILYIGKVNKKVVPPHLIEQFKATVSRKPKEERASWIELYRRPILRRSFILVCLLYMCCVIVFDGIIRNIGLFDADFFVSFSVISAAEFPSMLLVALILDWSGRRWLTLIVMTVSSTFTILSAFVSTGLWSVICAITARFAVNMSYAAALLWTAEVLPTSVRGTGVSIAHVCGFIATVISSYIAYLGYYLIWLPSVIIGILAAVGGVIALLLPETAKRAMPHTFDEAEELGKNQKFWDMPCLRKPEDEYCTEGVDNKHFDT